MEILIGNVKVYILTVKVKNTAYVFLVNISINTATIESIVQNSFLNLFNMTQNC